MVNCWIVCITHEEIMKGGDLVITASAKPNKQIRQANQWISDLKS